MIWNPGDGGDLNDGGPDLDTTQFNGANGAEVMNASANGGRVAFLRNPGNVNMDIANTETLSITALGGDDQITAGAGLLGLINVVVNAGAGADIINSTASTVMTVDGSTEVDTLNFDAENQLVSQTATTIAVTGLTRVTHTQVENINITDTRTTLTYSLAEGAAGTFFDLDILVANPTATPAPILARFLRENLPPITQNLTINPMSRVTLRLDAIAGLENASPSTIIESTSGVSLIVERTMFWDAQHYGAHGGTAVDGPRTRWLFAEGSQGFFSTFVLLANRGHDAAQVTHDLPARGRRRRSTLPFTVAPTSRLTVSAADIPELANQSFSIVVTRRCRSSPSARCISARPASGTAATSRPACRGIHELVPRRGCDRPVLRDLHPGRQPQRRAGERLDDVPAGHGADGHAAFTSCGNGRLTVNIELRIASLANAAVSTTVSSDVPVIAERAMYWPGAFAEWHEAHNSFGATAAAPNGASPKGVSAWRMASRPTSCWPTPTPRPRHRCGSRSCARTGRP